MLPRDRAAHAQPTAPAGDADARPWAAGVPAAEQAIALALYDAGNRAFTESHPVQAIAKYNEALLHWDHPAIRYNLAVCLIDLDQPAVAREDLERSLAFGEPALGPEAYRQAMIYRKLLDAQLSRVTIAAREPGVVVLLDGKWLFTGPGEASPSCAPARTK